jgi:glutamine synthetase
LAAIVDNTKEQEPWFGIEQEYTICRETKTWSNMPLGFNEDENGELEEPAEQGPYYCSTGAQRAFGRSLVDRHMHACLQTGLAYCGQNAEVMPGQWEFQIGTADPLTVADDLTIARWLLDRLSEEHGWSVLFSGKPLSGDWNGAGCHTNFSTKNTRDSSWGTSAINLICEKLAVKAQEHIEVYGAGVKDRLTGDHETCSWEEFRYGISDRGASIRIPWQVAKAGHGYIEDRRPNANCDPYLVLHKILETCCT